MFSFSNVLMFAKVQYANVQCTHYTFNGDIKKCYLKNGYATKNDATPWYSDNVICGIPR